MENLSFEIDLLSSDTLAHVNTIIELDYERPDIALLAIRRGAGIRRRCNKFTENWDSWRHILGSSPVGRVDESPIGLESSGGLDAGRD